MNEKPDQAKGAARDRSPEEEPPVVRCSSRVGGIQWLKLRTAPCQSPLLERPLLDARQIAEAKVESSDLKCLLLLNLLSTYCVPACSGHQGLKKQFAPTFAGLI